jgi:hypothetical protein
VAPKTSLEQLEARLRLGLDAALFLFVTDFGGIENEEYTAQPVIRPSKI